MARLVAEFTPLRWLLRLPILPVSGEDWAAEARLLRWLTLVWLVVGLAVLFSASYPAAIAEAGNGFHYFKVQLLWVSLGIVCFNWVVETPLRKLTGTAGIGVLVCLGLIVMTLIPALGITINGATRWLAIGPFLLQPSELIKPFLILQGANLFGNWPRLPWSTRLGWLSIFAIALGAILLQPNLSTTAVCGLTLWLMALAGAIPYIQLGLTAFGGLGFAAISISLKDYQRRRVISFLDPWASPTGDGYQLVQSLLAVGSGQLWGRGFGLSQQKLAFLPIQYTDFIFAVFAEEFGFVGSMVVLVMLATYATLSLVVAMNTSQTVFRLVAVGSMTVLVGQSLLNIGVATGTLPTTGLPFPLVSYGGSSMLSSLITAALLVRVARQSREADVVPLAAARQAVRQGEAPTGVRSPTSLRPLPPRS